MKKYIVVAVTLAATALTGWAQSSANLTLSGTVANNTTIAVVPQAGHNALPVGTGCTDQLVANVTEKSNNRLGYKVTLTSANAGSTSQATLKGAEGSNNDVVNYSMKYGGTEVTLSSGSAQVTTSSARTAQAGVVKALTVTIPESWVNTDTYSDTLTLTIAVN
ncbi:MAG TPA: hypothetical protein VI136_07255 [Verrucomicrobiae bacterium]